MVEGSPGEIIGRNVRAVREAQLFSRPELARRSGVSLAGIDHLERGLSARPRRSTVEKLAKALGVDVEVLMEESEHPLGDEPSLQEKLFNNGILDEEQRANVERLEQEARALLERVRVTLALLEIHMSDPPEEEEWDRALERYLSERADPLGIAIQLLEQGSTDRALVIDLVRASQEQIHISSRVQAFNDTQYGHRHRDAG